MRTTTTMQSRKLCNTLVHAAYENANGVKRPPSAWRCRSGADASNLAVPGVVCDFAARKQDRRPAAVAPLPVKMWWSCRTERIATGRSDAAPTARESLSRPLHATQRATVPGNGLAWPPRTQPGKHRRARGATGGFQERRHQNRRATARNDGRSRPDSSTRDTPCGHQSHRPRRAVARATVYPGFIGEAGSASPELDETVSLAARCLIGAIRRAPRPLRRKNARDGETECHLLAHGFRCLTIPRWRPSRVPPARATSARARRIPSRAWTAST